MRFDLFNPHSEEARRPSNIDNLAKPSLFIGKLHTYWGLSPGVQDGPTLARLTQRRQRRHLRTEPLDLLHIIVLNGILQERICLDQLLQILSRGVPVSNISRISGTKIHTPTAKGKIILNFAN